MPIVITFGSFGVASEFGVRQFEEFFNPVLTSAYDMYGPMAFSGRAAPAVAAQIVTHRSLMEKRLDGIHEMESHYGRGIPELWGKMRLGGNVIWCSKDFWLSDGTPPAPVFPQPDPGTPAVDTQVVTADFAVLVCKGPVTRIEAIWADDALVYQRGHGELDPNIRWASMYIHHGTEDQAPDPLIVEHLGAGNVPAYRGLCYVVFGGFILRGGADSLPTLTFLVHRHPRGTAPIADVLTDVATECGLEETDYDFSGVTGFT
jgi:hypothetical protein